MASDGTRPGEEELREQIHRLVAEHHAVRHRARPFVPGVTRIPYSGRVFDAAEITNAVDACLDFWLTADGFAGRFEQGYARFLGVSEAMLVNSGSSANLLALAALTAPELGERRLRPGDEVVTVAAGFPTTLAPIVQNGLVPVFVDVDIGGYNAIPDRIAESIGPRTRAIMLAHTMGNPFDAEFVLRLARERDLWVVEDNCDALGSLLNGRLTGTFGHLSTSSFYPPHHITMGEGGCVATSDPLLARLVRSFRDWGRDCHCAGGQDNACGRRFTREFGDLPPGYDHKYVYSHIGYNLRVTDIQAAIGCAQLEKLPSFVAARRANWRALRDGLEPFSDRLVLPEAASGSEPSWFGFVITVRDGAGFTRAELVRHLEDNGIATRNLFAGNLLRHPAFSGIPRRVAGSLENSDRITENTFFVGCYPGLTAAELEWMAATFASFFRKN